MGAGPLNDVFLSYAEEDGATALRVDDDLTRADLKVWRYEKDSRKGSSIPDEVRDWIGHSRFFCLLDSAWARKSAYIREECAFALALIGRSDKLSFLVCLVQPRKAASGHEWWMEEAFEGQNVRSYIDLTDYGRGIKELTRCLEVPYFPRFELPRDHDFENEVHAAGLRYDEISEMVGMYSDFRRFYQEGRRDIAEAQLRVLIHRCERWKVTGVISPRLALGVLQAESGRHRDAYATFGNLVGIQPDDPRAWAGKAGALFHLGDAEGSLEAYRRCQRLLDDEAPRHRTETAHNVAMTLLSLGRTDEAWSELGTVPEEPYILAAKGAVRLAQSRPERALSFLEEAYQIYRDSPSLPSSLIIRLADCYKALRMEQRELSLLEEAQRLDSLKDDPEILRRAAFCYLSRDRFELALRRLDSAVALAPDSLVYRVERAQLLYQTGHTEDARREAHRCFSPEDESPRERYYRGLAFHLLGAGEAARTEHLSSLRDPTVRSWPAYADLLRLR
jgi:tetratricopeptide (TPR) repeat protein